MTGHLLEKPTMNIKRASFFAVLIGLANACALSSHEALAAGNTELIGVAIEGSQNNDLSLRPTLSTDSRYVAFDSTASNLVAGDTNEQFDVFVLDRQTGKTQRVSVATDGTEGNGFSAEAALSADGRYVAFSSRATNLVPGDTNDRSDVFVHDRRTGATQRVSVASDGTPGDDESSQPALSADGRYVAFISRSTNLVQRDTNGTYDVFVHDRQTKKTRRISVASDGSQANDRSIEPALSANGRFVAFRSLASNLVPGDTNRGSDPEFEQGSDVFVHDRQTGKTQRVSLSSNGKQGNTGPFRPALGSYLPALSADGRYVAFISDSTNLVPGDTNRASDVFVHDRQTKKTRRVSVASDGTEGNSFSTDPAISADGRYVAFTSFSTNLVRGDTNDQIDVFIHDLESGMTRRASVASDGTQGDDRSEDPVISADGRYVAFSSRATNLVPGVGSESSIYALRDPLLDRSKKADLVVSQTTSLSLATTQGIRTASVSKAAQKSITFTTTLRNNGPNKASRVTLIGLPPLNCGLRTVKPSQGRCSRAAISICRLGDLPVKKAITVKVTVNATAGRICRNIASVNAPPVDPKGGNNASTKTRKCC